MYHFLPKRIEIFAEMANPIAREEMYKSRNANTKRIGKLKELSEGKKLKIYVNA